MPWWNVERWSAEFYMADNDPPSMRVGGGRLAARIVRPLPRRSVLFHRAVATGATVVVEEHPCGGDGRQGAGGVTVQVILIDEVVNRDGNKDSNGDGLVVVVLVIVVVVFDYYYLLHSHHQNFAVGFHRIHLCYHRSTPSNSTSTPPTTQCRHHGYQDSTIVLVLLLIG